MEAQVGPCSPPPGVCTSVRSNAASQDISLPPPHPEESCKSQNHVLALGSQPSAASRQFASMQCSTSWLLLTAKSTSASKLRNKGQVLCFVEKQRPSRTHNQWGEIPCEVWVIWFAFSPWGFQLRNNKAQEGWCSWLLISLRHRHTRAGSSPPPLPLDSKAL